MVAFYHDSPVFLNNIFREFNLHILNLENKKELKQLNFIDI